MNRHLALGLPAAPPSDTVVINAHCMLRTEQDQRVVVVGGLPVYHYCAVDAVDDAYAMVMLVECGFAQQTEVPRAFSKTERTVRRYQERYGQGGMAGLGRPDGGRRGRRRISGKRLRLIERLKGAALRNRAIAQRLGVSEMAIRKLVGPSKSEEGKQLAFLPARKRPPIELPMVSAVSVTPVDAVVDPPPAREECAQEAAVLEEEAEADEAVSMWLATIRTFDEINS